MIAISLTQPEIKIYSIYKMKSPNMIYVALAVVIVLLLTVTNHLACA